VDDGQCNRRSCWRKLKPWPVAAIAGFARGVGGAEGSFRTSCRRLVERLQRHARAGRSRCPPPRHHQGRLGLHRIAPLPPDEAGSDSGKLRLLPGASRPAVPRLPGKPLRVFREDRGRAVSGNLDQRPKPHRPPRWRGRHRHRLPDPTRRRRLAARARSRPWTVVCSAFRLAGGQSAGMMGHIGAES